MNLSFLIRRSKTLFALVCAALMGCDDADNPEPDATETVYQEESDWTGQPSYAILESDTGVFLVLNDRLLHVAKDTRAVTQVAQASRIHDALSQDETYVYFASQLKQRSDVFASPPKSDPQQPDGHLYRALKRAPFTVEELTAVNVLAGGITLHGGKLFVCESEGTDGAGDLLELSLAGTRVARRWPFRPREYCRGVVADDTSFTMVVDRTHRLRSGGDSRNGEETFLALASGARPGEPWDPQLGPRTLGLTKEWHVDAFFRRGDELVLATGSRATVYTGDGLEKQTIAGPAGTLLSTAIPGGWAWSKNARGTFGGGQFCNGGRLYGGATADAARELTQGVCFPRALGAGESLWLLDTMPLVSTPTERFSLKRLPLPKL